MTTEHPVTAANIAEEAVRIVNGARQGDYGDTKTSFDRIAGMWSGYLGHQVSAYDVCHLLILLKVARAANKYHRDSYVDIAGYALCAERVHNAEVSF